MFFCNSAFSKYLRSDNLWQAIVLCFFSLWIAYIFSFLKSIIIQIVYTKNVKAIHVRSCYIYIKNGNKEYLQRLEHRFYLQFFYLQIFMFNHHLFGNSCCCMCISSKEQNYASNDPNEKFMIRVIRNNRFSLFLK